MVILVGISALVLTVAGFLTDDPIGDELERQKAAWHLLGR
jgi:hypothetical protein